MGQKHGEYEPNDSRNVTGTASTPDGRWTRDRNPPAADGFDPDPRDEDDLDEAYADEQSGNGRETEDDEIEDEEDEGEEDGGDTVSFTPDPELQRELDKAGQFRTRRRA